MKDRRNINQTDFPYSIQCRPEYYVSKTGYKLTGKHTMVATDGEREEVLAHNLPLCSSKTDEVVRLTLEREEYQVLSVDHFFPARPFTGIRFSWEDTECMGSLPLSDKLRIDFTGLHLLRYNTVSDINLIEITIELPEESYTMWIKVPGVHGRVGDHIADLCAHLHGMKDSFAYDQLKLALFQHIFNCTRIPSQEGALINTQWKSLEGILEKLEDSAPKSAVLLYAAGIIWFSQNRLRPSEKLYSGMACINKQIAFTHLHKFLTNRYEGENFNFLK